MQAVQRAGTRSVRSLKPRIQQRQTLRHASESKSAHGAHDAHNNHPVNESLGPGFYVTLAALPASFALFKLTQSETAAPTRWIQDTYNYYAAKWARRNDLHVQALEQAAADRVLFLNESVKGPYRNVDLRFPEQFNVGSPYNVPAGHGTANIDQVIEKYQREAYEDQERKLQQVRENKVPRERPVESLIGTSVATPAGD